MAASAAQAQTLLSVDVNDGATSPAGFSTWDLTAENTVLGTSLVSTTFGSIGVALNASSMADEANAPAVDVNGNLTGWSNGVITRNRGPITTTAYGGMYQGFATPSAAGAVGLQISGLSDNTEYSVTFYSFDENGSRTSDFIDYTGGTSNFLGAITYSNPSGAGSGDPTFDSEYSLTVDVATDSSGRLTFDETQLGGNAPVLNGFSISAVPEPATVGSLLAGAAILFGLQRFRVKR
jgi:hypothetical protein